MTDEIQLNSRKDLHLFRKAWHIFFGSLVAFGYFYLFSKLQIVIFLSLFLLFYVVMEIIRFNSPAFNAWAMKRSKWLARDCEVHQIQSGIYFSISTLLSILLFPKLIAVLSILYLGYGDPVASFFGILWGKHGPSFRNGKSWIGTFAGMTICSLWTVILLRSLPLAPEEIFLISLLGGITAASAEAFVSKIDDNLSVPLISGFVLWGLFKFFQIS